MTYKKTVGDYGEWLTANEYEKRGYKIAARNFKVLGYKQIGEIDIIATKGREIVFVEVKTRSSSDFMDPLESVGYRKQQRLLRAIKAFLSKHPEYQKYNARIDVSIVQTALDAKLYKCNIIEDVIQDLS